MKKLIEIRCKFNPIIKNVVLLGKIEKGAKYEQFCRKCKKT